MASGTRGPGTQEGTHVTLDYGLASFLCVFLTLTVLAQQNAPPQAGTHRRRSTRPTPTCSRTGDKAAERAGSPTPCPARSHRRTGGPIPRNYIDEQLFGRMDRDGIPHAGLASDEEFCAGLSDATGF